MTKPTIASHTALAALFLMLAACQTTQPNRFDQADANHDSKLSRDEVNTFLVTGLFDSRDANHDKRMTQAEWVVDNDPAQTKAFHDRDANRDGVVTLEEALAYGRKHGTANQVIHAADADKDGSVSRDEMTAYYASKEGSVR
jgi:hypothetical protein